MQPNKVFSLFGNSNEDARFLEMVQDSSKRQERLRVLERRRTISTWSLFVFAGLLLLMAVAALTSSTPSFFPVAMTVAMAAGAAVRQSDADAQIKMIKLYVLLTQNSDRATR